MDSYEIGLVVTIFISLRVGNPVENISIDPTRKNYFTVR